MMVGTGQSVGVRDMLLRQLPKYGVQKLTGPTQEGIAA
jgi:hypothetical protein